MFIEWMDNKWTSAFLALFLMATMPKEPEWAWWLHFVLIVLNIFNFGIKWALESITTK